MSTRAQNHTGMHACLCVCLGSYARPSTGHWGKTRGRRMQLQREQWLGVRVSLSVDTDGVWGTGPGWTWGSMCGILQNGQFASCCIRTNESPAFACTRTRTCSRTQAHVHAPAGRFSGTHTRAEVLGPPPLAPETSSLLSLTPFPTLCRARALQNGEQSTKSLPLLRRS